MIRILAAACVLAGLSPAPQEGASVPALLDAVAAIGRLRWNSGSQSTPCILLLAPSGDTLVAARMSSDGFKALPGPFEAVFKSDSAQPVAVPAKFLAHDKGVGWFKLEGPATVKPVDIKLGPAPRPGATVFAAGIRQFERGKSMAQLSLGVVETAKSDERQDSLHVRSNYLLRDFEPLVMLDASGRLLALESGGRLSRTPGDILDSIEGAIVESRAEGLKEEFGRLKGKLIVTVSNPMGRMKSVTALMLQKGRFKEWPKRPNPNGRWPELGPQPVEVRFTISENTATAELNVPVDKDQERYWAFQYRVVRGDGAIRHSEWSFLANLTLGPEPSFSRRFEEPPAPPPRPPGPDVPLKPANVPTGSPVATGISLLEGITVDRGGVQITHSIDLPMCHGGCWSSDYRYVYLLDGRNVVRKISFPEFREICEYGIGYACSDIRRSGEGLVVLVSELREVWVLSHVTLALKTRIPLGTGARSLSVGERSSTAWVFGDSGEFLALDLSAGRVAKRIKVASLEAGAAKAVRPAQVEPLQVSMFEVSPNGRHLVVLGNKQIHRFSINEYTLAYDEISPEFPQTGLGSSGTMSISPDSHYLSVHKNGRTWIYRTTSFQAPVVEYSLIDVLGFDKNAGVLYGSRGAGNGLSILRVDGSVERTFDSIRHARRVLVHPEGSRVLVVGNELTLLEVLE